MIIITRFHRTGENVKKSRNLIALMYYAPMCHLSGQAYRKLLTKYNPEI